MSLSPVEKEWRYKVSVVAHNYRKNVPSHCDIRTAEGRRSAPSEEDREVWIAIGNKEHPPRMAYPPLRTFRFSTTRGFSDPNASHASPVELLGISMGRYLVVLTASTRRAWFQQDEDRLFRCGRSLEKRPQRRRSKGEIKAR